MLRCDAQQDDLSEEITPLLSIVQNHKCPKNHHELSFGCLQYVGVVKMALEPLIWLLSARSAIRKRAMLLCAYDVIFLSVRLDPALYVVHGHFSNRVMAARRS